MISYEDFKTFDIAAGVNSKPHIDKIIVEIWIRVLKNKYGLLGIMWLHLFAESVHHYRKDAFSPVKLPEHIPLNQER